MARVLSMWQRGVSNWRVTAPYSPMLAFPRKHLSFNGNPKNNSFFFYRKARAISQAIIVYLFLSFFFHYHQRLSLDLSSFARRKMCFNFKLYGLCQRTIEALARDSQFETVRRDSPEHRDLTTHTFPIMFLSQLFDKFFTNSNPMEIRVNAHWVNARATVSKERRGRARERERKIGFTR